MILDAANVYLKVHLKTIIPPILQKLLVISNGMSYESLRIGTIHLRRWHVLGGDTVCSYGFYADI